MWIFQIERNYYNRYIWEYSNKYIYKLVIKKIEQYDNIHSLSSYLKKSKDETIKLLRKFIKHSNCGKIIVNQNYELCKKEELFNDGTSEKDKIPEELKNISIILGYDVKKELVHEKMGRPCVNSKTYGYICSKIDELMKAKYENANNYNDPKYKEAANNLIENYFERITKEKAEKYFSFTFSNKESIILNVLYDKKENYMEMILFQSF